MASVADAVGGGSPAVDTGVGERIDERAGSWIERLVLIGDGNIGSWFCVNAGRSGGLTAEDDMDGGGVVFSPRSPPRAVSNDSRKKEPFSDFSIG